MISAESKRFAFVPEISDVIFATKLFEISKIRNFCPNGLGEEIKFEYGIIL
jgi:hypothetical protein